MNHRKYPLSMFMMGVVLELVRLWYVLAVALLLFLISLFVPAMPIVIPVLLLFVWMVWAILKQLKNKKEVLNMNVDEETNALLDKMFTDNHGGYQNVIDAVSEIIEENETQPD